MKKRNASFPSFKKKYMYLFEWQREQGWVEGGGREREKERICHPLAHSSNGPNSQI